MAFAGICSSLFVDPVSDMDAENNASVGAGGFLLFPLQYSVDEYIRG